MFLLAISLLCRISLTSAILTASSSIILKSLKTYAGPIMTAYNMTAPLTFSKSVQARVKAPGKDPFSAKKPASAEFQKYIESLRRFRPEATGCAPFNSILFDGAKFLGDFVHGVGQIFIDNNANGVVDAPAETDFVTQSQFSPLFIQGYALSTETSDVGFGAIFGGSGPQIDNDPNSPSFGLLIFFNQFVVPDLFSSMRYAPMYVENTAPFTSGPNTAFELQSIARSSGFSCATKPPHNVDVGYLFLPPAPVPGAPSSAVGGFNMSFTAAGMSQCVHMMIIFFDENADNFFNPWERTLSAAAVVKLQNTATSINQQPFVLNPALVAGQTGTFGVSPVKGDDTNIVLTIIGTDGIPCGHVSGNLVIILRPENLGTLLPKCAQSQNIVVAKNNLLDAAGGITPTSESFSMFVGTAQKVTTTIAGTNTSTAAGVQPYAPIRAAFNFASYQPQMRSSNQFPLQCSEDSNTDRTSSLSKAAIGTVASTFSIAPLPCTGVTSTATNQLTLGTNPSCPFQICFNFQQNPTLRLYETARFMTFAALLTNATQSLISTQTNQDVIPNYSISLSRGALSAYNATVQTLSSGIRKITFFHSLTRDQAATTTLPDLACMVVNFTIDYSKCPAGGQNMLLEFEMLAATLPFPDFTIASRAVATQMIQDARCVNFTGLETPTPTPTPAEEPIESGEDHTLTWLLVMLLVFLLALCCVWFYTY